MDVVLPDAPAGAPDRLAQAGFDDLPEDVPVDRLDAWATGRSARSSTLPRQKGHWHLRLLGHRAQAPRGSSSRGSVLSTSTGSTAPPSFGLPVLLETFSERALPFYLRNGLEVIVRRRASRATGRGSGRCVARAEGPAHGEVRVISVCVAGITGWTGSAVAAAVRQAGDLGARGGLSARTLPATRRSPRRWTRSRPTSSSTTRTPLSSRRTSSRRWARRRTSSSARAA